MINKAIKSSFPSQAVSDLEKMSLEYGSKVGRPSKKVKRKKRGSKKKR